jgi:WD40 repeat protein/tRNA A-37 threonylcarbamoyl transferase component Bud32
MSSIQEMCPRCGETLSHNTLHGLCRKCLSQLAFGLDPGATTHGDLPHFPGPYRLGKYELLEEIARGGMGVVYKARQTDLNRIVAVKVVLHGPFSSDESLRRFRNEAEAVAGLRHPNIVTIHEVGEHDGHHFFSMEYIEGEDLSEIVRDGPLPARRAAEYLKTVAEAIHYAHQQGILHRDLKPSNVLLDIFDQPRVTDFGLAKLVNRDQDATLTTTGQVLGSPNHMPPEQASGQFSSTTPSADIYSLGALLYHLITGRPPFQGETLHEILLQVQTTAPISPRRLNPSVPVDLQTICLKCLQKEPARRYASAGELADELGRYLENQPIQARPVSPLEKLQLWCRRRPLLATLTAALLAAIGLGLAGILWQWQRAELHAQGESRQRQLAEDYAARTRLNLYAADVSLASQAVQRGDYGLARRTLAALQPGKEESDLRGFEWRYLWNLCRGDQLAVLTGHQWIVTCAAFSPDGKRIATGSQDGTAKIWNAATHELIASLPGSTNAAVWSVGFSPDGRLLMTAGQLGVRFWKTDNWQLFTNLPGKIAVLSRTDPIAVIADSSPLFWEPDGKVSLWNYSSGEKLREFNKPGRSIALSADGTKLAIATTPRGIDLWNVATGRQLRTLETDGPVWSLNFSPDGNRLVATDWSSEVLIWDLDSSGEPVRLKGHTLTAWSAQFSPDGSTIVTTGSDQTVRVWDAASLQSKSILHGHWNEVWCAAFNPDGTLLATGGKDQRVMLWNTTGRRTQVNLPSEATVPPIFSTDGTEMLLAATNAKASHFTIWDAANRTLIADISKDQVLGFAPERGELISWETNPSTLKSKSYQSQTEKRIFLKDISPESSPFVTWGFSPEFKFFFALDGEGWIRIWELATGDLAGKVHGPMPPVRKIVLGPGGTYLAVSVERESIVHLYECASSREMRLAGHKDFVSGLAFSPDGATLASGSMDGTIRLWTVANGMLLGTLPGHMEETTDLTFSPDGRTLASLGHRESIRLWHVPTRRELVSIDFPQAGCFLSFSPDGHHLAVATEENSVQLFEAPSLEKSDLAR